MQNASCSSLFKKLSGLNSFLHCNIHCITAATCLCPSAMVSGGSSAGPSAKFSKIQVEDAVGPPMD